MAGAEAILSLERVATIATMPSRIEGLEKALNSMLPQVDRVFVYLDNFTSVPGFLNDSPKISVFRAEEVGNYHSSSRFLALGQSPCVLFPFDDDIIYPPDYAETLVSVLGAIGGRTMVGVHGRIFKPPHKSYIRDAVMTHFATSLPQNIHVHELGAGTCAFLSGQLNFNVAQWPSTDMDDLLLAIEAQKRSIRRIVIKRTANWLQPIAENQPDSLWSKTKQDDLVQSNLMRLLLKLY